MMNGYEFDDLSQRWVECDAELAAPYEQELRREVPAGHLLHNVACSAIATYRPSDDVLFWLPEAKQWAIVHLTWQAEQKPVWPSTTVRREWSEVCVELDDQGRR